MATSSSHVTHLPSRYKRASWPVTVRSAKLHRLFSYIILALLYYAVLVLGQPTNLPTTSPTSLPTSMPTTSPTSAPSSNPTNAPTTPDPTAAPTDAPTTPDPTAAPTDAPTTPDPTAVPTNAPTTPDPTMAPTDAPTTPDPTMAPTDAPTTPDPTSAPTIAPTTAPTDSPTYAPTSEPKRLSLSTTSLPVVEGGKNRTYVITLDYNPVWEGDQVCVNMTVLGLDPDVRGIHILPNATCLTSYGEQRSIVVFVDRDFVEPINLQTFTIEHSNLDEPAVLTVPIINVDYASVLTSASSGYVQQGVLGGAGAQNAQYNITLATTPLEDVVIDLSADSPSLVIISPSTLTFAANATPTQQIITISAADAETVYDVDSATIRLNHEVTSADTNYDGASVTDYIVAWKGADHPRVTLSTSYLQVVEGSSTVRTFTVRLDLAPSDGTVGVSLDSSTLADGAALTISPSELNFTTSNYATAQTVQVTYSRDYEYRGATTMLFNITATITEGSSEPYADAQYVEFWPDSIVAVDVEEVDQAVVYTSDTSGSVYQGTIGGAGAINISYTIGLSSIPEEDVIVTIAADKDELVTISPSQITFSAGESPSAQTIVVSAADATVIDDVSYDDVVLTYTVTSDDIDFDGATVAGFSISWYGAARPKVITSLESIDLTEGSSTGASFTVKLGAPPSDGPAFVSLYSQTLEDGSILTITPDELEFSTSNWSSPQRVQVTYPLDHYDRGADEFAFELFLEVLTNASSQPYALSEYIVYWPTDAITTTVREADQASVVLSSVLGTVRQGVIGGAGALNVLYTIELTSIPTDNVTLSIEPDNSTLVTVSPSSIVFLADELPEPQTITVSAADATLVYDVSSAILNLVHYVESTDTVYDNMFVNNFVVDWFGASRPKVIASASALELQEGSNAGASFTIKLGVAPSDGDVKIALQSSHLQDDATLVIVPSEIVFSLSNWSLVQTVRVTYPRDNEYRGSDEMEFSLEIVIAEGSSQPYQNQTYVVFSPGQNISATVYEVDEPGVILSTVSGTVQQGVIGGAGAVSAQYSISLASIPEGNVTISISADKESLVSISPSEITFAAQTTPAAQMITVSAVDSTQISNVSSTTVVLSHTAQSSDSYYNGIEVSDYVATWYGASRPRVVLSLQSLEIVEGANTVSFMSLKLGVEPSNGTVKIDVASSLLDDSMQLTLSPTSFTFGVDNYTQEQVLQISYPRDYVDRSAASFQFNIDFEVGEGSSQPYTDPQYVQFWPSSIVVVTVVEADQAAIAMSSIRGIINQADLNGAGGMNSSYTITLATIPVNDVTITLVADQAELVTIIPNILVFSAEVMSEPQTITISAADATQVSDESFDVVVINHTVTSNDTNYDQTSISDYTIDWYGAEHPRVVLSASTIEVIEGTSVATTFFVKLALAPTINDVVIDVSSNILEDGSTLTLAPAQLTFSTSNWNTEQSVRVTYNEDNIYRGAEITTFNITLTVAEDSGSPYNDAQYVQFWPSDIVAANVYDADLPEIVLSEQSVYVTENGQNAEYQIALNSMPESVVTISIAWSNTDLINVEPSNFSIHPINWTEPHTILVSALESDDDNAYDLLSAITILEHSATSSDPDYDGEDARFSPTHYLIVRRYENPDVPNCPAGTYLHTIECIACPAGFACSGDSNDPVPCKLGSFSISGQTECTLCPAGKQCPSTSANTMEDCVDGSYSEVGQSNCTLCPAGYMCPDTKAAIVQSCIAGTYSVGGQTNCTACPAGSACPSTLGTDIYSCSSGTYSLAKATICQDCPAGYACTSTEHPPTEADKCQPGSYSVLGAFACTTCPAGFACPDTTAAERDSCGFSSSATNFTYSTAGSPICITCPAGQSCTETGTLTDCESGSYSLLGERDCTDCPEGSSCSVTNAAPIKCSPGNYQSLSGQTKCDQCEAGSYCPYAGTITPSTCPANHYSDSGASNCTACPAGYYCTVGSTVNTYQECEEGTYCPSGEGIKNCPAGKYGTKTGAESEADGCASCPAGYYCLEKTTDTSKQECDPGYYCLEETDTRTKYPCPAGTYNPDSGGMSDSDCLSTPAGHYTYSGSSEISLCPAGYFCEDGADGPHNNPCPAGTYNSATGKSSEDDCVVCEKGYYCDQASTAMTLCPQGTYNPYSGVGGNSSCLPCEKGYACPRMGLYNFYNYSCAPGYYCPASSTSVTEKPCPAGTFSDAYNLYQAKDCETCPAGKACAAGITSSGALVCSPGHYCPLGTQTPTQHDCPGGTYSSSSGLTAASECTTCPAGRYCEGGLSYIGGSDDADGYCGLGYYCPQGTIYSTQYACPEGTYSSSASLESMDQCTACDLGHYCANTAMTSPTVCPGGTYANETSLTACKTCPAGYECPEGTDEPVACLKGEYSASGQSECSPCLAGHYCYLQATTEAVMESQACAAGLWCPGSVDVEPSLEEYACPVAQYCVQGTSAPAECPPGTYNSVTGQKNQSGCKACDAGFYCLANSSAVSGTCDPGYYCPQGSSGSTQIACPAKTYRNQSQGGSLDDCSICPSGSYCTQASVNPTLCPRGSYCLTASSAPQYCPIGRYSNRSGLINAQACSPCPGGFYCDSSDPTTPTGLCEAGYYCLEGSYTSTPNAAGTNWTQVLDPFQLALVSGNIGDICPFGHYCEEGSSTPIACPSGTFCNILGAKSIDDCSDCVAGQYCAGSGNEGPTGDCYAGYFCPAGSASPVEEIAPAGTYAPEGSSKALDCPYGTFNSEVGKENCTACLPGYYCNSTKLETAKLCPQGSYCPSGSVIPKLCPKGTYSNMTQLTAVEDCTPCDAGSYCASNGLIKPSGLCSSGYYCTLASSMREPSNNVSFGNVCPAGYYCEEGSASPEPCPLGTYGNTERAKTVSDCKSCEPGNYCGERGLTEPSGPCSAGYFCNGTASIASQTPDLICPEGYYCPAGTSHPIRCEEGSYAPDQGMASCTVCPGGYYCTGIDTTQAFLCPEGSYCPPGTGATPPKCPPGTFSDIQGLANITSCSICPAGNFCENYGLLNTSGVCDEGYVCDAGSITQYGGGVTCLNTDNLEHECPRGFYCMYGRTIKCPIATYNPILGQATRESCRPCEAGYWCFDEATAYQTDYPCPVGHYCESSTALPIPCPSGTYRDIAGGANFSDCTTCPPGKYCPGDAALTPLLSENNVTHVYWNASSGSSFALSCPAGTYCTGGNVEPQLCPIGYGAADPEMSIMRDSIDSACIPCPAGTSGSDPLRLECVTCDPGYVCVDRATTPTPLELDLEGGYICPVGYYCPAGTLEEVPCPPGSYANETGGYDVTVNCHVCARNTYNDLWGASGCKPCASSSSSSSGSQECTCQGRNRAFEPSTGKCLCMPGFEAYDQTSGFTTKVPTDEDGTDDCQPITYSRCSLGQVLNADGVCVTEDEECATECADLLGTGRLSTVLGVCDCDGLLPLDQVCGSSCRGNATSGQLVSDTSIIQLSNGSTVNLEDFDGFYGATACNNASSCPAYGCIFGLDGSSACDYNIANILDGTYGSLRRRLVTTSDDSTPATQITRPVVCINVDNTIIFRLEAESDDADPAYPVYKKDSLLNTNDEFDYGYFRYLEGAAYVRVFAFTFQEAGLYVFGSSQNLESELVISVQARGSTCPTEDTIMPRSTSTLFSLGARRSETILLEPDWSLLGALLGGMAGLVSLLLVVVFCFREFALGTVRITPRYRTKNSLGNIKKVLASKFKIKSRSVAPIAKAFKGGDTDREGLTPLGTARWAEEDMDPRELVERLVSNHEEVSDHLNRHDAKVENLFGNLQKDSLELKALLNAIKEDGVRTIGATTAIHETISKAAQGDTVEGGGEDSFWSTPRSEENLEGSLDDIHQREQELLERSWQESAERELEELNSKLDAEAEEAMLEEQLKHEEQLEEMERMLLERDDISEEERERILRDFERDQEILRDTLDLEKRRQQEDLKNRLAERNLRSYRATKRRQRSEKADEVTLKTTIGQASEEGSEGVGITKEETTEEAEVREKREARKKEQVSKLLSIQEEADLEELDLQLQREQLEAETTMAEVSKDQAIQSLEESDRAKLEQEMLLMRAKITQQVEDEARQKMEDFRAKLLQEKQEEIAQLQQRAQETRAVLHRDEAEEENELDDLERDTSVKKKPRVINLEGEKETAVMQQILAELAEEEVEAKVEIEAALEESTREESHQLQQELSAALADVKAQGKSDGEAQDLVTSIREDYKRKMDQLQEETATKRKAQYEALKNRLKNRRRTRVKEAVEEEHVDEKVLEEALDEHDSDADIRLELELQARKKEDASRRHELDRREAEIRQREAEIALRMAAEKEGKNAEEEVKRLRASHEAAIAKLGDSQSRKRDKQREALKRRAEERRKKREEEEAAAAEAAKLAPKQDSSAEAGEGSNVAEGKDNENEQEVGTRKSSTRATALWENAVDRISTKLQKRMEEARALEEEKAKLGEEHQKVIEEMRRRQEEERKRLEEEMEGARQKLLRERQREEDAAKRLADDERRRQEEEIALSAQTAQELEAIKEQHQREFNAKQEQERMKREKQREKVMKKLEEKKARKRALLERRQHQEQKKTEAKSSAQLQVTSLVSREDEVHQEKTAIAQLMKRASPDIEPNELYRAIEKILEPRHTREKLELSQKQFQKRTQQIKTKFAEIQNEKHEKKKDLIRTGASMDELEALEATCKEKLRDTEVQLNEAIEAEQKTEEEELIKRQAQEIGKYIAKYSHKPRECIQEDVQGESVELRAILQKEREFRLREIQNERTSAEQNARDSFDKAILELDRALKEHVVENQAAADAAFQTRKNKLLQKQTTSHDVLLKTARSDQHRAEMRAEFSRDRERLSTAIRAEHLRQVKSVEVRVERLKAKSARYFRRVLETRLRDIADMTSRKIVIMDSALQRMFAQRDFRADAIVSTPASALSPPGSPTGGPDAFYYEQALPSEVSPRTVEELQAMRKAESMRRLESINRGTPSQQSQGHATTSLSTASLEKKLESIEILLQSMRGGAMNNQGSISTDHEGRIFQYTDPTDAAFSTSSEVIEVDQDELLPMEKSRLRLGARIARILGLNRQIQFLAARSVPVNAAQQSAFSKSFHWDADNMKLFLRVERLTSIGDFILVLVHCLAHIKVHKRSAAFIDSDPAFIQEFHAQLRTVNSELIGFSGIEAEQEDEENHTVKSEVEPVRKLHLPARLSAYSAFSDDKKNDGSAVFKLLRDLKLDRVEFDLEDKKAPEALAALTPPTTEHAMQTKLKTQVSELERKISETISQIRACKDQIAKLQVQLDQEGTTSDRETLHAKLDSLIESNAANQQRLTKLEAMLLERKEQLQRFIEQDEDMKVAVSAGLLQNE